MYLALIYLALGAAVKYIDAAFDDGTFSKRHCALIGSVVGLVAGGAMIADHATFVLFGSILIAVAITGKLDNLPFRLLAITTCATVLIFGYRVTPQLSDIPLFAVILVGAVVDEIGNDWADGQQALSLKRWIFLYRGVLKILVIAIATLHWISALAAINFLLFDFGYFALTFASAHKSRVLQSRRPSSSAKPIVI